MPENFLEELVVEWYQFKDYFVRRNVKFGKLPHGGYRGEMDVLAFKPDGSEFLHIETSGDALTWAARRDRFGRKFEDASKEYVLLFNRKPTHRIAIVGLNKKKKESLGAGIEVVLIPEFIGEVAAALAERDPYSEAVPEQYPLLRAIQYAMAYARPISAKATA